LVDCVWTHDNNETLIVKQQIEIWTVRVLTTLEEKTQRQSLARTLGDREKQLETKKLEKEKQ